MTELKNWAWEGATHSMKDSVRKIETVKSITLAKKIKIVDPVALVQNIISVPIESISASISIPVNSVCDSCQVLKVQNNWQIVNTNLSRYKS